MTIKFVYLYDPSIIPDAQWAHDRSYQWKLYSKRFLHCIYRHIDILARIIICLHLTLGCTSTLVYPFYASNTRYVHISFSVQSISLVSDCQHTPDPTPTPPPPLSVIVTICLTTLPPLFQRLSAFYEPPLPPLVADIIWEQSLTYDRDMTLQLIHQTSYITPHTSHITQHTLHTTWTEIFQITVKTWTIYFL